MFWIYLYVCNVTGPAMLSWTKHTKKHPERPLAFLSIKFAYGVLAVHANTKKILLVHSKEIPCQIMGLSLQIIYTPET